MRYLKMFAVLLVPLVLLALAGCGSDSSTVGSPFSSGVTPQRVVEMAEHTLAVKSKKIPP